MVLGHHTLLTKLTRRQQMLGPPSFWAACFKGYPSHGILPRHQMGVIDVYMDTDTAPVGVVVVAKNGAGAAGQPAVYDLVYPVPVRFLVANAVRQCIPCVGRLLSRKYLCRAGSAHAEAGCPSGHTLLASVFADAPAAVAAALCRALVVADL